VKSITLLAIAAASAVPLAAQWYPRHNFTFGAGGASPQGELADYGFENRPGISVAYGYRFSRYLQADAGLDVVFGAGGIRDYLETDFGPLRIRDRQFFVPLGGRAILPVAGGRMLFFGGGGIAWLKYSELLHQPSDYYHIDCPVCSSRSGWGGYALAGVNYFLDSGKHFRVGATVKSFRGHTEGDPLADVPGIRTNDRWINVLGDFGFSF